MQRASLTSKENAYAVNAAPNPTSRSTCRLSQIGTFGGHARAGDTGCLRANTSASQHVGATVAPKGLATPIVALDAQLGDKTLYVINTSPVSIAPSGWALTAIDAHTGAVGWKLPTAGMIGKPAIANGVIYFAPQDGYIYAVDAATGHQRWRFQRTVNINARVGLDGYPAIDGQHPIRRQ